MEVAINELRNTVSGARKYYQGEDEKHAYLYRAYVQDIVEDIGLLEKYRTSYKDKEQEAVELMAEARRLKRDLEKEAYLLEAAAKKKETRTEPTTNKPFSNVKLPRIKLPMFEGHAGDDYRGFMGAFTDTLSCEPNLGAVQKWLLLRAQLSGAAFELVKELPTAPETYAAAVKILDDAYGSTRRAILKLYQRVQALPNAAMNTVSLRTVHAQLEGILMSLVNLGVKPDDDDFLRSVIISKFPNELIHLLRVTDDMPLAVFRKEVGDYVRLRDCTIQPHDASGGAVSAAKGTKGGAENGSKGPAKHVLSELPRNDGAATGRTPSHQVSDKVSNNSRKKRKDRPRRCYFCTGDHWSDECDRHRTLEERRKVLGDRCQRCLRAKHGEGECTNKLNCFYCQESTHHSAMCSKQFEKVMLTVANGGSGAAASWFVTAVLPVSNLRRSKSGEARAVLDTAGGRSLITRELADELELTGGQGGPVKLVGVGEIPLGDRPSCTRRLLLLPPSHRPLEIDVLVVPSIADDVLAVNVAALRERYPRYRDLTMPREGNGERVQLLLGYRCLAAIVTLQNSIPLAPRLQLMSTKFGWIPFGGMAEDDEETAGGSVIGMVREADPVRLMCDLELVGLADLHRTADQEEELALAKFYAAIKMVNSRYEVAWPYREAEPFLEDNFGLAYGRLVSLHRSLVKTPKLLEAYDDLIRGQLENGVVEPVSRTERGTGGLVHYLPHRAVVRLGKSTPVRIVFDAAARANRHARSLNDLILKGSNWVSEIPAILIRFRRYGVGVTSDIARAFHQISIAPSDRDAVRFLWLRDPRRPPAKENLCVYRFRRMAFGIVASPFLLSATIRHHLRQNPHEFAVQVEQDMYADNLVTSLPREMDGARFYRTVKQCFQQMSMDLSQWATDCPQLRARFETSDSAAQPLQTVLGLNWNLERGELAVRAPKFEARCGEQFSKRGVLREMASVYDPLGWMAPVVLKARIFLRKIWRRKYTWEATLEQELAEEWRALRLELLKVDRPVFQRAYGHGGLEGATALELHAFCDASLEAYGVVVYLRVLTAEGVWTGIVAAKSRLSPNQPLSVPRLELLAAVTACRYLRYVEQALKIDKGLTKYLWGDSRCVIAWVSSNKLLPAVVERSVNIIREAGLKRFNYVPSAENPADVASRGATVEELIAADWWRGPSWLADEAAWPLQSASDGLGAEDGAKELADVEREESQRSHVLLIGGAVRLKTTADLARWDGSPFGMDPAQVSTFGALTRRTAFCLRAAGRFLRGRGTLPARGRLDYALARKLWLRWDQQRAYTMLDGEGVNASYLRHLRVARDDDGLLRCCMRLGEAAIARDEAEPILLVRKSVVTRLIVLSFHLNNGHAGTAHTLAALRRRYWLPHGRREVYGLLKAHCNTCPRYGARPFRAPELAPLPAFRITRTETPFVNVGVDAFGPFRVRVGRGPDAPVRKRWVVIFTCLVVRAVHLEVLREMAATEFLLAFRRFVGRRGVPRIVFSDNAPQFYAMEGYFQSVWHRFAEADVTEKYYAQHSIEWRFIPPEAPWMGGAYERLIKEVKATYFRIYGTRILSDDQFEAAMIEIEGVINSRPITYVSKEEDAELITPGDFLCLRYPGFSVDFSTAPINSPLTALWREGQEYLNQFWKIWAERYLRELRERRDSFRSGRNDEARTPEVGEVVLMADPLLERSTWRTAVVERLIADRDGRVRSAQIRSSFGTRFVRPIVKLVPLRLLSASQEEGAELVDQNRAIVVSNEEGEITL